VKAGSQRRMNWKWVLSNLAEAREELQRLERLASRPGARRTSIELEIGLGHAYHHLNAAWNGRRFSMARWRKITSRDYRMVSRWPRDVWVPGKDKP